MEENSEIFQLGREFHEKSMQDIDKDLTFAEFIMIKVDPKNSNLNLNNANTFKSLKENIIKEMCEPIQNQIEIATAVNYDNIIDEMKKELMIYNLEKEIKNIKNSFNDFKTLKDVEKKLREDIENIKTFERVLIDSWTESAMQDQKLTFEQNEEYLHKTRDERFKDRANVHAQSLRRQALILSRINKMLEWFEDNEI